MLLSLVPPFSTRAHSHPLYVPAHVFLGEHELEPILANLYLVAVAQVHRVHPHPVDVGPVEAPDVAYPVATVSARDLRVLPGDGDVVKENVALGAAPDGDDLIPYVVHPP